MRQPLAMSHRFVHVAALMVVSAVAGLGHAQEAGKPVIPASELDGNEVLANHIADPSSICWELADPAASDWLAQRDAGYRQGIFERYVLDETENGWRWLRRDGSGTRDLRPAAGGVAGVPYTELEVHARTEEPWARLTVESALRTGRARFTWTAPPERLCMADGLRLEATAEVLDGEPGAQQLFYMLPLTPEQQQDDSDDVRACRRGSTTGIDSDFDVMRDEARCRRDLYHLVPGAPWTLMLSLPESFYVIYTYEPDAGKRR